MKRGRIRKRPIDDKKPYSIYKDLEEAKKKGGKDWQKKFNDFEKDLYDTIEYFDKIKKKQIPKTKIINDKNETNVNYNINNNIIYTTEKNDNSTHNNSQYVLNCNLTEFKRPDSYIIYSSTLQNMVHTKKKLYEATEADKIFLKIRDNFMELEELENIIIDLEINCINEKDDKINEELAKKLIETKYSKYINYSNSIIFHFKDRRMTLKKSFIRQKWHKNKSTDKFLINTFKKRKEDKRQTRKTHQNEKETLIKLIEEKKDGIHCLETLMENMYLRETSTKKLLKIEELKFKSELEKLNTFIAPVEKTKEGNISKETIERDVKFLEENENNKKIVVNDDKTGKENKNNNILLLNDLPNNSKNIKNKNNNNDQLNIKINKNGIPNSLNNSSINDNKTVKIKCFGKTHNYKNITGKNFLYINQNTKKYNGELPSISLNSLIENNISLNEENNNLNNNIKNHNKLNNMRLRIRTNRNNQIVIDRYLQGNSCFDPFDDNYNNIFSSYNIYQANVPEYMNDNNFEKMYNLYNLNKLNTLNLLDVCDDDDTNDDLMQFSNSYQRFLQLKRAPEQKDIVI